MRALPVVLACWALAFAPGVCDAGLSVRFDSATGRLSCADPEYGTIFEGALIRVSGGRLDVRTSQRGLAFQQDVAKTPAGTQLTVKCRPAGRTLAIRFDTPGAERSLEVRASYDGPPVEVGLAEGHALMGPEPIIGLLKDQSAKDQRVLTTTLGPANVAHARALFDRERDLALTIDAEGDAAQFVHHLGTPADDYRIMSSAAPGKLLLRLALRPHYYRDELGITHYAPLTKRSFWKTAPVVAMAWYGTHVQTKENLFPLIDWVAAHLLPYAGRHVFQLDDAYNIHDDAGMRAISDHIRAKGLIPGIWFTPFAVVPPENYQTHRDWFLHGPNGEALRGFGGISYGFLGEGQNNVLDARNAEVSRDWFKAWWRKASETWGYDFFKIDGQPWVADVYRQAAGDEGVAAYRAALSRAREVIGPDRFINGCWGIPLDAIGRVNGSRTGGDTGNQPHAMDVVLRWNFLNNVAWWCDPDAAANLAHATAERVRLNTQARALTGQQFLTDDIWTDVPDPIAYVWQRGMPSTDVKPANLYPIEDWGKYEVLDLKVEKPWSRWDVVGIFNYGALPRTGELKLGALGLSPGSYQVYDYWAACYLGQKPSTATIPLALAPYEGKLLSFHHAGEKPIVLSTSRHITQGGPDLIDVRAQRSGDGWEIVGTSDLLVQREPYAVTIAAGNARATQARVDNGKVAWSSRAGVSVLTITPAVSGQAHWSARLARPQGPVLEAEALIEGAGTERSGVIRLANPGTRPIKWRAEASDGWLALSPSSGTLAAGSAAEVALSAKGADLPYDTWAKARVTLTTSPPAPGTPIRLPVEFYTGLPPNLALTATAFASSVWSPEYEARMANDGSSMTRWNSKQGENDDVWLALTWPEPVRFDRVVVDETPEWGLRIQQWVLEARDGGEWREVARGTTLGPARRIDLPVTSARELHLRMPKATVTPTINEMEVYLFGRGQGEGGTPR